MTMAAQFLQAPQHVRTPDERIIDIIGLGGPVRYNEDKYQQDAHDERVSIVCYAAADMHLWRAFDQLMQDLGHLEGMEERSLVQGDDWFYLEEARQYLVGELEAEVALCPEAIKLAETITAELGTKEMACQRVCDLLAETEDPALFGMDFRF